MFNLNAVLNIVGANTASVRGAVSDINTEMDRGTRKARGFADSIALKGVNLGAYTATSLAVIKLTESISAATRDALRFEVEMVKVAQTVGISTEEAKKHGEEIRKLSVLYGLSAPKIAETVKVLAQAGYTLRQAKEAADSLAQTTLLASFESISDTTDGLIAVNKQFIETVGKSAAVLSVFNVVSKKYAVESSDLVEVVRKAGGTFSATGGKLEELLAVFTTVRDTTRESAETIAVGLRTIFSRLQRPKTIEYLKQFGIELVNLEGQFVGNFEAIQRIQRGLDAFNVRPGSIQFAEVVEKIGGVLQQSRVIPLLTQGAKLQQVYSDAQSATSQTAIDLAKAQDTLSFKIAQTQQNFAKMIGEIAGSDGFDTLVRGVLSMTNAMIHFGSAIKDVIPLVSALLAFNLAKSVGRLSLGGLGALGGRRFASGGFVPGSGSGDTVPAMLTPGEFVIRKSAAQAMGAEALHGINKYADGGRVSVKANALGSSELRKRVVKSDYTDEDFKSGKTINDFDDINLRIIPRYFKGTPKMGNSAFEQFVARETNGEWTGKDPNYPVDIINAPGVGPIEVRNRNKTTSPSELADKLIRYRIKNGQNPLSNRNAKDEIDIGQITVAYNSEKMQKKKASGGGISGTDTVPSLLTPGEFVVNKKSAQAFGYGNLHKVNKYASGGRVGVQRFASGGVVGGAGGILPGLEGLGDLAIVVNQLIPALGSMTSSFAKLSIAASITQSSFSGIFSAGKGVSDFFTAYKNEAKKLSDVRDAEIAAYKTASEKYDATSAELAKAQIAVVTFRSSLSAAGPNTGIATPEQKSDIIAAEKSARLSISRPINAPAPVLDKKGTSDALDRLDIAMKNLVKKYGSTSEQVNQAINIQRSLNGNLKDKADAVAKYSELVIKGSVVQQALVDTLEERQRAEAKATAEAGAKINTGGIRGKIGAGFKALSAEGEAGDALRGKVQAGISAAGTAVIAASAYFASSTRTAAQALESLSDKAVAAGNSQEAYNQSIAASAKEAQAAGIETGTSAGGAVGSAVAGIAGGIASFFFPPLAPLIPLFISLGGVVGSAIGGILGFSGAITAFTDWLGITNSEEEAKAKAQEKELAAGLVSADKISSTTLSKSSDIRKFDPKAADTILFKGVRELTNLIDTEKMIGNKEVQEQAKALFTAASSSIDELSNKSENAGKSFAQLSAENRDLFRAYEESSAIIEGNNAITQAQRAQIDAVAVVVNKEKQVRETAINVQLRQLAIQERVNQSLLRMDKVTNAQSALMGQLDVALGGGLSSKEIGSDLSNMDSRNTNSDAYKRGLDAVARMGPEFAETSSAISKTIPAIRGIGTTITQMQDAGDTSGEIKEAISASLMRQGLSNEIIENISTLLEGEIDPKTIEADIRDKVVKPLADGLEPVRKSINQQLDDQLTILKKLSELDQNRLAIALSGFEASLKTSRAMDKILGVDADPMAERGRRLTKGNINLQGTSLQGMPLTGGAQDLGRIANEIKQNELKKLDIERRIKESDPNTKFGLQKEFTDLASETDKLKAAMSALSDVNEENAALEEKLAKSRANREAVRGAATDLAFGTNNDRGKFFKTLNQARGVAFTGSAEIVNPEDRGAVKSFLTTFKNLPAFAGGQTGQQVLDSATKNYLVNQLGVPLEQVDLVMKDFTRSEMDTVELIRANLSIDEVRNTLLENILTAISRNVMFNAPNAALPDRPAGPFLGIGGVNNFSMGGEAPDDPSNIFKPKGSDTVPAMLTPGEFIVSAKYAKRNMRALTEINSGSTKYLEFGSGNSTPYVNSTTSNREEEEAAFAKYMAGVKAEQEKQKKQDNANRTPRRESADSRLNRFAKEEATRKRMEELDQAPALQETQAIQQANIDRMISEKEKATTRPPVGPDSRGYTKPTQDQLRPIDQTNSSLFSNQQTPAEAAANESAKISYDAVNGGGTLLNTPSMRPIDRLRPEDVQKNKDHAAAAEILVNKSSISSKMGSSPQPKMTGDQLVASEIKGRDASKKSALADDTKSGQIGQGVGTVGTASLLAFKQKNHARIVAESKALSERPAPKTLFGDSTADKTPYRQAQDKEAADIQKRVDSRKAAADAAKKTEEEARKTGMGVPQYSDEKNRPKTIAQLMEQRSNIRASRTDMESTTTGKRLDKRQDKQRERIDKRIDKLKGRAEKTRGDRGEERLQGLFNPQAPQLSEQAQAQVINEYGPTNSRPSVLQPGSPPPMPNLQSQASSNPTGFISGGRFSNAPQGASGSPTGQTGQAGQDFSSLTSSLEAFNTGFSTSVKELASIPKTFEHNITMPTMSITLNGAEFIAKLPEEMKRIITDQINANMKNIISQTTESIANGGIGIFGHGPNSRRTPQAPA